MAGTTDSESYVEPPSPPSKLEQALEIFNGSEFPRRVAGVARSLGAPSVNVRSAEHHESTITSSWHGS